MKRFVISCCLLSAMLVGTTITAQDLDKMGLVAAQDQAIQEMTPTQDMWFYLQELRRYDDPQVMIRRVAERKAEQRRQRLAAMKWFGYCPSRPMANPIPSMGVHSPMWIGGGPHPYQWIGNAHITTAIRVENSEHSRR
jgi:hypothetical protein